MGGNTAPKIASERDSAARGTSVSAVNGTAEPPAPNSLLPAPNSLLLMGLSLTHPAKTQGLSPESGKCREAGWGKMGRTLKSLHWNFSSGKSML